MIVGIGMDAVEITRFKRVASYAPPTLRRIYSPEEIVYCLKEPAKSAERFAARFAAKEALYKALHQAIPGLHLPLLTFFKQVSLHCNPAPSFIINWQQLSINSFQTFVTITHSKKVALAQVIIQAARQKS